MKPLTFEPKNTRGLSHLRGGLRKLTWCMLLFGFTLSALCQFSIPWSTLDGGGGTSTGGVYTVTGTIGQPDAGKMSGGNFTLDGGFWGVIAAVQTPGAPLLSIILTTTNSVLISWPLPADGWVLKENADLNTTNWVSVAQTPEEVGGRKQVVISPPAGSRFYRLHKQ
jgi:hypothetical protein